MQLNDKVLSPPKIKNKHPRMQRSAAGSQPSPLPKRGKGAPAKNVGRDADKAMEHVDGT